MNDTTHKHAAPHKGGTTKPGSDTIIEQAEGLFEQAKGVLSDAFDATVDAVKERPYAAAGIAAGAAAAVAGVAFGASKLLAKDDEPAKDPKKK